MNWNRKWQPAIDAVDRIIARHGGTFYDRDTGATLDAGQAVCRQAYGPHWQHSDDFKAADDAESPPDAFMKAAAQLEQELPAWCMVHKLPGLAEALEKTDPELQQEPEL